MQKTLILDSGGHSIKVGTSEDSNPKIYPNCIYRPKTGNRLIVSDEIDNVRDTSSIFHLHPIENGYTVNWDVQRTIWEHIIHDRLRIDPSEFTAVVTEPEFDPQSNQRAIDEVFFEDYGFDAIYRTNNSNIVADRYMGLSKSFGCVIVESGHSFTHIVPYWKGKKLKEAVVRLNIGGKVLTNYLKEMISYRQLNLMDEFMLCEDIKESLCYCTADFKSDMKKKDLLKRIFVLPDFNKNLPGRALSDGESIEDGKQWIRLTHERFQVPEILFSPHNIGIDSLGLHEAIHQSILKCSDDQQPILYRNIMAVGGNASFGNFKQRVLEGVRSLANDEFDVRVGESPTPVTYAWTCAQKMTQTDDFIDRILTRSEWHEQGFRIAEQMFYQI